ncbi:alpha/beta fold hydrolase [Kribbella sp. NPDC050124]|uniref:alpha/beta fold hydrolase n=1 Tax=Kribbella sp. NPDC050124 TaxID=3364114 RepID=UPI0037BAA835
MRPPRSPQPPVVHRFRPAEPGGRIVYVVHPGALAPNVHTCLADALSAGVGLSVLDLGGLPEYWEAALTGGHADTTIETLAVRLLEIMADPELPTNPYTLAGWSFGGVIALAMAHLMAAEQRPERLVLIDSIAPIEEYKRPDDALDPTMLLEWFALYLAAKRDRPVPLDPARLTGGALDDDLGIVLEAAIAGGALPPDTALPGLRKLYATYVDGLLRNNRLTLPYRPAPAPLPLLLVKADQSLIGGDPALGWKALAPAGLELHTCPGDHYSMLSRPDAAAVLARAVHPV